MSTDDQLGTPFQKGELGDQATFNHAAKNYCGRLHLLAKLRLDKVQWAIPFSERDVVQETLSEAWQAFPTFRGTTEEEFIAWLNRICRNKISNMLRATRTRRRDACRQQSLDMPNSEGIFLQDDLAASQSTPSSIAARNEQYEQLHKALEQLPEDQLQVVQLKHQEDWTLREIAELLGCKIWKVFRHLARGLEKLRELMEVPAKE